MKKAVAVIAAVIGAVAVLAGGVYLVPRYIENKEEQNKYCEMMNAWADFLDSYKSHVSDFEAQSHIGIGFYNDMTYYSSEEIASYESEYAGCNTYTMYNTLSEGEQIIYRAFEYAAEHYKNYIFIEKDLADESTDFMKILYFLSCDSPFVEQNLYLGQKCNLSQPVQTEVSENTKEFGAVSVTEEGYTVDVASFCTKKAALRIAAYEKAESIVGSVPDGLSQLERAEYLYRYLCKNTSYAYYRYDGEHEQLYDALISGTTTCDGFANALSLICNLAGIPCFEKVYMSSTEGEEGHTWNCFFADGEWYNADATYDSGLDEASVFGEILIGFGFSDKFESSENSYADLTPVCSRDTLYSGCKTFGSDDAEKILSELLSAYKASGNRYAACILTDIISEDKKDSLLRMIQYSPPSPGLNSFYFYSVEYKDFSTLFLVNAEKAE